MTSSHVLHVTSMMSAYVVYGLSYTCIFQSERYWKAVSVMCSDVYRFSNETMAVAWSFFLFPKPQQSFSAVISSLCCLSMLLRRCGSTSFCVTSVVVGVIMTENVGWTKQNFLFGGGCVKGVPCMCWWRDVSRVMHQIMLLIDVVLFVSRYTSGCYSKRYIMELRDVNYR